MTGTPAFPAETTAPKPIPARAEALAAVAQGRAFDPHAVLGAHLDGSWATIRLLRPLADQVVVITADGEYPATHEQDGIWVAVVPAPTTGEGKAALAHAPDYRVRVTYGDLVTTSDDGYRFLPTLGEMDLHLIREGRHEELWRVLGAHIVTYPSPLGDTTGTSFSVWAPNAEAVRVIGEFNGWGSTHPMRSLGSSGVWDLFVPGLGAGATYKYEILAKDGSRIQKADPMARGTEVPPATASVVVRSDYTWGDDDWLAARAAGDPHNGPLSAYEVHLGSWRMGLDYRAAADQLAEYVVEHGFTHVELMPVAEHPFGGSWGYQVTGYYAPTSRFGHPDDFRYLVDRLHRAGVGVIVDWVPGHFPRDTWALARFDGTPLYEHPDPLRGEQPDWGTFVFDYGRAEVRNFLVANACYWFEEFHVDGLRVDAVASMLYLDYSRGPGQWHPNVHGGRENLEAISFLQEVNATVYRRYPGIMMIAEESTAWPGVTRATNAGGLGFGLKWNMGWMNDSLRYMGKEPIYRRYHHNELTFSLVYAFSEQYVLPISHDEVVHGKGSLFGRMPGDDWQKFANVRAFLAYQWSHPGKQLLFMGSEWAQRTEWNEGAGLDWAALGDPRNAGVQRLVKDLNAVYRAHPALWQQDHVAAGFEWIEADDADRNLLAYVRHGTDESVVVAVVNFAGNPQEGYRLALPQGGTWREILNTDAEVYGGSGVGNLGAIQAEKVPHHGRAFSASLRVPPLGAVFLAPA